MVAPPLRSLRRAGGRPGQSLIGKEDTRIDSGIAWRQNSQRHTPSCLCHECQPTLVRLRALSRLAFGGRSQTWRGKSGRTAAVTRATFLALLRVSFSCLVSCSSAHGCRSSLAAFASSSTNRFASAMRFSLPGSSSMALGDLWAGVCSAAERSSAAGLANAKRLTPANLQLGSSCFLAFGIV